MFEEDEDLVLGHSPLDEYLRDVTTLSFSNYNQHKTEHSENSSKDVPECVSIKDKFFNFILKYQFHHQELLESCVYLLKMSCLTDDEENLLKDVKDEVNKELLKLSNANCKSPFTYLNNKYVYFAVMVMILSLIYGLVVTQCFENLFGLFSFVVIIFLCVWRLCNNLFFVQAQILESVKVFHDIANTFDCFLDKAILHLKEVEIINHGKMVFRFDASKPNIDRRSTKNECLALRNVIMDNLSSLFLMVRTNQRVLLQNQFELCDVDCKEEYLSQMPIESFADVLQCSINHARHDLQCLPLDRIKTMVNCYRCVLSEFVYKVTVSLYLSYVNNSKANHSLAGNILWMVQDITRNMLQSSKQLQCALNSSVKLIFKKENDVLKRPTLPPKAINSLLHSSRVHLHSALTRIDEIEEQLSKTNIQQNDDILRKLLIDFSLALENSKVCIDDALFQKFPLLRQQKTPVPEVVLDDDDISDSIKLFESVEPEGDVLYEGDSEVVVKKSSDLNHEEEIERALKNTRESRKLMKELKIILSAKDTPVGLLPFPLLKPSDFQMDSDEEFSCGTDSKKPKYTSKSSKSAYYYEPSDALDEVEGDDESNNEPPITRFRLPVDLPGINTRENMTEETFGSSDDES